MIPQSLEVTIAQGLVILAMVISVGFLLLGDFRGFGLSGIIVGIGSILGSRWLEEDRKAWKKVL
jgi:hypothetical protein